MKRWSLLKRIIWLFRLGIIGVSSVLKTVTGNPIHITDALAKPVQALSISLEPIQDLHGYDNPWPAGGGKNKFNPADLRSGKSIYGNDSIGSAPTLYNSAASKVYVNASYLEAGQTYTLSYSNVGAIASENSRTGYLCDANGLIVEKLDVTWIPNANSVQIAPTVSGWLWATFDNSTIDIQLESGSEATSFAPFANLCPLSGHTDADVTRTGVNLFDKTTITDNAYVNGQGQVMTGFTEFFCSDYISVKPETAYYLFTDINGRMDTIRFFDANKAVVGSSAYQKRVVTTPANCYFVRINAIKSNISADELFFNYPATDTAYHAYVGTTYPIPIGTTVYGGQLDVLTGVLTVTMAIKDMGSLTWTEEANHFYSNVISDAKPPAYNAAPANMLSSLYKNIGAYYVVQETKNCTIGLNNSRRLYAYDSAYTVAADFKTAVTGQTICYELATPQTIQLTPQQVELLQGENNLFSDGEMTLTYLADGNASDIEALNILLGNRYVNNHEADEPSDREALDIVLGGKK